MNLKPLIYNKINFDSPEAVEKAYNVLRNKKCLRDIYTEQYQMMYKLCKKYLFDNSLNKILEIGSGGGFIKDIYPDVIASDIGKKGNIDVLIDAEWLPFKSNSLNAIFGVHVIHHIPNISNFLKEADRVLKNGGVIICIEPYWGPLATFIYKNMHPEPFDKKALSWNLEECADKKQMIRSNQALSYLLLKRDKDEFKRIFPQLELIYQKPFGFIRYFFTGGVWLERKLPDFCFPIFEVFEEIISPLMFIFGLHHVFVLRKNMLSV